MRSELKWVLSILPVVIFTIHEESLYKVSSSLKQSHPRVPIHIGWPTDSNSVVPGDSDHGKIKFKGFPINAKMWFATLFEDFPNPLERDLFIDDFIDSLNKATLLQT